MGRIVGNLLPLALIVLLVGSLFEGGGAAAIIAYLLISGLMLIVWLFLAHANTKTKGNLSSVKRDADVPTPPSIPKRPEQPIRAHPVKELPSIRIATPATHEGMIWRPDRNSPPAMEPRGLVPCPACGHRVSLHARACPNCGHPLRRTEHKIVEVCHQGSSITNQVELDEALAAGWQIVSEDDSETWTYRGDNGTVHCRMYKYSLVRY